MNLESSFEEVNDSALSFDKSALSEPVDRSVVHAEFREMYDGGARARGLSSCAWFSGIGSAVGMAFLAASLILILAMIVRLLTESRARAAVCGYRVVNPRAPIRVSKNRANPPLLRDAADRWYRLRRFAASNGLTHDGGGAACCSPLAREPRTEGWAGDLARMFKALGDPVRLRLLSLVASRRVASHAGGEACVCDIAGSFDLSQPTISHHLKVLREAGLRAPLDLGVLLGDSGCVAAAFRGSPTSSGFTCRFTPHRPCDRAGQPSSSSGVLTWVDVSLVDPRQVRGNIRTPRPLDRTHRHLSSLRRKLIGARMTRRSRTA